MPLPEIALASLTPYDGRLVASGTYDGLELRDLDLSGVRAPDCAVLECGAYGGRWDDLVLAGGRIADSVLAGVAATALDAGHAQWRDVLVRDCRWGAVEAPAATWTRVGAQGGRWDYVNLRGSELTEVRLEGLRIGELDLGGATVHRLTVVDCIIERLSLHEARLAQVDLTGATLTHLGGITGLAGATITGDQCLDLARAFAAALRIDVAG